MNKKSKIISILPIIWLILILEGCTLFSVPQDLNSTRQITPFENTSTSIPLDTPTSAFTRQPQITPTITRVLTPTYNWLLPSDPKSIATVSSIMDNNGGCQLPCWWGITPGKTNWDDAKAFLSQFNVKFSNDNDQGKEFRTVIYISTSEDTSRENGFLTAGMNISNGIINRISIDYFNPKTHLSQLLNQYGQPDQVFVNTLKSNMGGPPPFRLYLFYPKSGILAIFHEGDQGSEYKNKIINACTTKGPSLYLWKVDNDYTIQEVGRLFGDNIITDGWNGPLIPIQKATGMSTNQFYNLYKAPNHTPCFQTPMNLWPDAENAGSTPQLTP